MANGLSGSEFLALISYYIFAVLLAAKVLLNFLAPGRSLRLAVAAAADGRPAPSISLMPGVEWTLIILTTVTAKLVGRTDFLLGPMHTLLVGSGAAFASYLYGVVVSSLVGDKRAG